MADTRLRQLERRAIQTGDPKDIARLRAEQRRAGVESIPAELDSDDWAIVFCEGTYQSEGDNTTLRPRPAIPGDKSVSLEPFSRSDVAEVLHIWEEACVDYADWSGTCVVRLFDGRFASASGWSDSSGWG